MPHGLGLLEINNNGATLLFQSQPSVTVSKMLHTLERKTKIEIVKNTTFDKHQKSCFFTVHEVVLMCGGAEYNSLC